MHEESILGEGRIVGRMTSGSFGHTIGWPCAHRVRDYRRPRNRSVHRCLGSRHYQADVTSEPFYDPTSSRLKG
jgi:4-methylaminobutanoate oxidase (formaldehyde-forming)